MLQSLIFILVCVLIILYLYTQTLFETQAVDGDTINFSKCINSKNVHPFINSAKYEKYGDDSVPPIDVTNKLVGDIYSKPFKVDPALFGKPFGSSKGELTVKYGCEVDIGKYKIGSDQPGGYSSGSNDQGDQSGSGDQNDSNDYYLGPTHQTKDSYENDPDNMAMSHSKSGFKSGLYMGTAEEKKFQQRRNTDMGGILRRVTDFHGNDVRFDQPNVGSEMAYTNCVPDENLAAASKFHAGGYSYGATISPKLDITDWR